jgi:hypothetical protein
MSADDARIVAVTTVSLVMSQRGRINAAEAEMDTLRWLETASRTAKTGPRRQLHLQCRLVRAVDSTDYACYTSEAKSRDGIRPQSTPYVIHTRPRWDLAPVNVEDVDWYMFTQQYGYDRRVCRVQSICTLTCTLTYYSI